MTKRIVALMLLVGIGGVGWVLANRRKPAPLPAALVVERPPYDSTRLAKTIAFYEGRVKSDPIAAIDSAALAGLYVQRCRETGDIEDALRGEKAARHSLAIRRRYNAAAYDGLALSLFMQHRFAEALQAAEQAKALRPDDPQAADLVAETRLELGDYTEAEAALRAGPSPQEDAGGMAIRARLLEINGQPEAALATMRQAQKAADTNFDMPPENVAWHHMRVGEILASLGRAAEAERAYREALDLCPRDPRTLTALTRLAAGRGDWQATLAWGQKAAAVVPTPEVVALLGDAYSALGRTREAEGQYGLVEAIGTLARVQGVVYDRQRALFCADHRRNLDEGLRLARKELIIRHDVYAYDTLAWACYQKGQLAEADAAMQKALARGTRDARMFYHAGMIAHGRGDQARAKDYLSRALALNPFFAPFAPERARALLAQIDRGAVTLSSLR